MFLGGIIPGVTVGLSLMTVAYFISKKRGYKPRYEKHCSFWEILVSFKNSLVALLLPVIIVGGILSGIFTATATEAGVVGVVYAGIVGFALREIKIGDLKQIFLNAAKTTANILFLMGTSAVLGWILTSIQLPQILTRTFVGISSNPKVIMLIIVAFILFLGCFMTDAAIVPILAPLLLPVMNRVGIDPVQFGVVMCITAVAGNIMPPVGGLLFVTCGIGNVPIMKAARAVLPFLGAIFVVTVLCILIQPMVTFIPNLLMK